MNNAYGNTTPAAAAAADAIAAIVNSPIEDKNILADMFQEDLALNFSIYSIERDQAKAAIDNAILVMVYADTPGAAPSSGVEVVGFSGPSLKEWFIDSLEKELANEENREFPDQCDALLAEVRKTPEAEFNNGYSVELPNAYALNMRVYQGLQMLKNCGIDPDAAIARFTQK